MSDEFDAVLNHAREDVAASPNMWQEAPSQDGSSLGSMLGGAIEALWDNAIMPAAEKLIPQGAAELGNALFTGSAYMPYGPTNEPVAMGQETGIEAQSIEPAQSYESLIQETAAMQPPQQEPELGLER